MVLLSADREKTTCPLCLSRGGPRFVAHRPRAATLAQIHPCTWGLALVEREDDGQGTIWVNRGRGTSPEPLSHPQPPSLHQTKLLLWLPMLPFFFFRGLKQTNKLNSTLTVY